MRELTLPLSRNSAYRKPLCSRARNTLDITSLQSICGICRAGTLLFASATKSQDHWLSVPDATAAWDYSLTPDRFSAAIHLTSALDCLCRWIRSRFHERGTGRGGSSLVRSYQITVTPYFLKRRSAVTIAKSSTCAWAMSIRSKGSLWRHGNCCKRRQCAG